ncbi:hypothetical protein IWW50_001334 [Coemansia erecta]|nr:hypothetical protein IWW50_001334 [Coemansia erecta]
MVALDSTPITIASVLSRNNAAGYGAFAEENKHAILEQPLEEILGYLGGNWADAWQFAQSGNGVFSEESVQSIIRECYDMHLAQTQNMKARSEDVHQAVLGALMSIIEARLKQEHDGDLGVEWVDTHLHPMPDGVKPDGILKLTGPHTAKDWRWVVAVFELRSDRISANQPSLVGQLVSRMVNMSKDQPRHFSMGFTGSKDGDMVFYLGLPTMVDYTKIGRLPLYRVGGNSEISAVRFLMLIYWMLPQFNGFVTSSNQGLYGELSAMLFTGIDQADASHLAGKTITVQGGKAIGGRRGQLVGPKSWIFKANLRPRDIFGPVEHILKFHWFASGYREGPIHAVVQKLGVPHVPRLVWSGIIPCQSDYKLTGEIMLVEFSGEDIKSFFEGIAQTRNNWQMIDMFAGYFHALLVAATGSSTDGFILHRDISCMNLLVRDSQPFVIDWGNGIHAKDVDRVASKNNRVGTAPFMGLRAIVSASTRSLVDDIESLFLVYSFCMWSEYGEGTDDYYKMWSGASTMNDIRGARQRWLTTEESYLAGMGLTDCPGELVALGCSLYKLLFLGTDISVYSLVKVEGDPRVTRFSTLKWVAAFKAAAADPDIPGPGTYDVHSSEAAYKKYGFLSQSERFKAEKAVDDRQNTAPDANGRSLSRAGSLSRRTAGPAMTAIRAEESRYKREIEHYQKAMQDLQTSTHRETRMLKDKVQQAEEKVKDLLRERTDIKKRLMQREVDLRAKERDRDLLATQLEKQQAAMTLANPKTEKQLKENAEQASAMCTKLKAALDKTRRASEEDKRRLRQLEYQMRKLEQERDTVETELKQMGDADYPRQIAKAQRELRHQEEHYREKTRKLGVELQEAKDLASRYMNELGEAAVHNTALENELQLAVERAQGKASDSGKQLDTAMAQLEATQARLAELERLSRQRAEESDRIIDAANEHVSGLKGEIERLELEREQVQGEMQGKIHELTLDYQAAKREFESSVKGADDERSKRLHDTQTRLERATKETLDLKTEVSELRGILLKKEMAWKDRQLELDGDLQAAASDYEALQGRLDEQRQKFDAHVQSIEEQARKKERAWSSERTGILEKLDSAHKDGFRLRDALDALQKEAAQTRADCDADLRRMGQELADLQAETEDRAAKWDEERKELARTHSEELAGLKDECAMLEQQLQDDRYSLETQLQDTRDELDSLRDARQDQQHLYEERLAEATDALEEQTRKSRMLEEQMAERDARESEQVDELEALLEEARLEHKQALRQLESERDAAQRTAADYGSRLESEHSEAEALRAENEDLAARMQELADANDELAGDCARLQDEVDELAEDAAQADGERGEALEHYTGLMQELSDKHRAEKAQWQREREQMQGRLDRYKYRENMWAIQDDHMRYLLELKEDARMQLVGEARRLFDDLQDEMVISDDQTDACAGLMQDIQNLQLSPASPSDSDELVRELNSVRTFTRRVFLESMQRAQEARISRVRVEGEVQELKFMRMQGQIVETVGEMSGQHKAERARLEADLSSARSDYRSLHETAAANRAAFAAQVSELEAKIAELVEPSASSHNAAKLEADNAALTAQVRQLAELSADLEARLEVFEYSAEDDRIEFERQRAMLESRNAHMTRVLEQCEVNMATHVEDINSMGQHIAELESERAILAEQTQFQISWLKENYSKAYQDLDVVLNNEGGHSNLRQRIRYVESLKNQILALKKESFECSRDRDRFRHHVNLLKSELDAYKEVNDVESFRARSRAYGRTTARRNKSVSRKTLGAGAEPAADSQRSALSRKGAVAVSRALEDARSQQQMAIMDE